MGDPGYYFYVGDYLRDTTHLTNDEDLAYRRLLDAYYSRGGPLPASVERLAQMARVSVEAVAVVAEEFFPVNGDGMRHNRKADKVLKDRADFSAEQSRKANKRWHPPGTPTADATAMPRDSQGNAAADATAIPGLCLPSPLPFPLPSSVVSCPSDTPPRDLGEADRAKPDLTYSKEFLQFYAAYPKRVDKRDAWKAWKALGKGRPSLEVLLAAIEAQRTSRKWKEGFIKGPATWLRNGSWEDEADPDQAGAPDLSDETRRLFGFKPKAAKP